MELVYRLLNNGSEVRNGKICLLEPTLFVCRFIWLNLPPPPRSFQLQSAVIVGVGVGLELNKMTGKSISEEVVHYESFTADRALPKLVSFLLFIAYHVLEKNYWLLRH